jgi:hypothetical protein
MKLKYSAALIGALGLFAATQAPGALLYSLDHNNLPASGSIATWDGATPIGTPEVTLIGSQTWSMNSRTSETGYRLADPSSSISISGASFVVAATRGAAIGGDPWTSIVDVMYDKLTLGIRNDTGQIVVRRNGSVDNSVGTIDVGQSVVLSLTAQTDGSYEVWANGLSMLVGGANGTMTEWDPNRIARFNEPNWAASGVSTGDWGAWWSYVISQEPSVTFEGDWVSFDALPNRDTYFGFDGPVQEFKGFINVGRNNPDGWTAFNGAIGDVKIFDTALSDSERLSEVSAMTTAMAIPEPSSALLLGLAGGLVAFGRRRRA